MCASGTELIGYAPRLWECERGLDSGPASGERECKIVIENGSSAKYSRWHYHEEVDLYLLRAR
jgi:hypothetical protein